MITGPSRDAVVDDFLENHVPVATATEFWGTTMQLAASAYITTERPPALLVTAVRTVVVRGGDILLMRNEEDGYHVLPEAGSKPVRGSWTPFVAS